jgi:hypothetical protein
MNLSLRCEFDWVSKETEERGESEERKKSMFKETKSKVKRRLRDRRSGRTIGSEPLLLGAF